MKRYVSIAVSGIIIMSVAFASGGARLYARDFRIDDPLKEAGGLLDYIIENKDKLMKPFRDEDNAGADTLTEKEPDDEAVVHMEERNDVEQDRESARQEQNSDGNRDQKNEAYLLLVNKNNPLDRDYGPESTINLANHVRSTKNEIFLDEGAATQFIEMIGAMEEDGLYNLAAVSGYRSYDYQSNLYQRQINRHIGSMSYEAAARKAGRVVAPPGTSEHQTGLAIDVSSSSIGYGLTESFENTKEFQWINEHSHEYGFIIRYVREKSDITDIIYEPWHLRYVGVENAGKIVESGLCLEEYLDIY